jgi:hypothetical protein
MIEITDTHMLRYLWLPDRTSLRIIMCGLLSADDYVTTTPERSQNSL